MKTERFDVETESREFISRNRAYVFERFWDPREWERVTPHVVHVEMIDESQDFHRFRMTISSGGKEFRTLSERTAIRPERIDYKQVVPPPLLLRHEGSWLFREKNAGTEVILRHRADIEFDRCRREWPDLNVGQLRNKIAQLLQKNGRLTISSLMAGIVTPRR